MDADAGCDRAREKTERARRGLLSILHADIETSRGMGGLHNSGSNRVSFVGTLSMEKQARKGCRGCEMKLQLVDWWCEWNLVM